MVETLPFGRWLRQLRVESDLTQEALAERVGCAVQTIRTFERGLRRPSRDMAERLAGILQIPLEQRAAFVHAARMPVPSEARLPPAHAQRETPAPKAPAAPRQRPAQLPVLSNVLIGRETERRTLLALLVAPTGRLVTLVGPGGIGKTRLALQVAADLAAGYEGFSFADGAAFVALAPVADAANAAMAIVEVLGLPLPGTIAPAAHLLAYLRERSLLLVLDNLEHLLTPDQGDQLISLVGAILREAPGVHLLVTSRERLRLQGERVVELGGLGLPDEQEESIERSDAVLLFVERARQTVGAFPLTPENRSTIVRICRLLDGVPLAIELAAAWVRALSCAEIADEVVRNLDFLALSDRDVNPRHRSMRAVIDHSWNLLGEGERRVLARLSVFRGGCRREATEAVAGATLPLLVALIDKSLLRHTPAGRYEMHEFVRQYAEAQLRDNLQEAAAVYDQHCAYYAGWLEARAAALCGPLQHRVVIEIAAEIDNLRAAWQYAVNHRQIDQLARLNHRGVFSYYFRIRSWYQEAEATFRRAAAALREPAPGTPEEFSLLGTLLATQGWCTFRSSQPSQGRALLEEGLGWLARGGDEAARLFALQQLCFVVLLGGNIQQALAIEAEMAAIASRLNDGWAWGFTLLLRASIRAGLDAERASIDFAEAVAHARAVGDRYLLYLCLFYYGQHALKHGAIDVAERAFTEIVAVSGEVGNPLGEVAGLQGLAMVACAQANWPRAIAQIQVGLARAQAYGDALSRPQLLLILGEAQAGSGEHTAAHDSFREALATSLTAQMLPAAIDAWVAMAQPALQDGEYTPALLTTLALVRRHPASGPRAAARAGILWATIERRAGGQAVREAQTAAQQLGNDSLAALLAAAAEGRAAALMNTHRRSDSLPANQRPPAATAHIEDALTERELDVLRLLAAGRSNQQIADELVLAIGTVKRHVNSILGKLQVASRLAAVARARELNLLD